LKSEKNSIINNSNNNKTLERNSSNINKVGMITRVQKKCKKCVFNKCRKICLRNEKFNLCNQSPDHCIQPEIKAFSDFFILCYEGKTKLDLLGNSNGCLVERCGIIWFIYNE